MPNVSPVGKLRNKITIQNNVLSGDTFGGYSTANTTFLTAFAQIKPKSAKQDSKFILKSTNLLAICVNPEGP